MSKSGNPTILDVAREADVAVGTVSRHINGLKIRAANRERIELAISRLGYRANVMARAMKTERTKSIGLLVPVFDEFNSAILTILVDALQARGYSLLTFHHGHEPKAMAEALEAAASRRIDGIILSARTEIEEEVKAQLDRDLPIAIFNNDFPGVKTDKVLVDDRKAAEDAVTLMLKFGHRRIGILTGDLFEKTAQNRLQGYLDAHAAAGVAVDEALISRGNWDRTRGHAQTRQFLAMDAPPTALFYSAYVLAMGGLEYLQVAGLTPGKDVHVVSFDDPDFFKLTTPGIAAVAQPTERLAHALADLLISRLEDEGGNDLPPRLVALECDFKLRGSLGINESHP